jgi:broad specificity phosphatase PhoE
VIVLVRHGQTETNRAGRLLGRADPPLNDTGRAQADALADLLAGRGGAIAVVSSPLRRAKQTAEAIAAGLGLDVEVDERLIEMDYGEWDGRALGEVSADDWRRWRNDPDFAPPGGEGLGAVYERVCECAAELSARANDDDVIAVSHVSPIKAAVAWALGAGPDVTWRLRLDVASVTRIAPGPTLVTYNETPYVRISPA